MAIYRAQGSRRLVIIGATAAIFGLVLGIALGRVTAPGLGAQLDDLRTQAAPIRSSLEVMRTEYGKYLAGAADPGGADGALIRIETVYRKMTSDLKVIDPTGPAKLGDAIKALRTGLQDRIAEADMVKLVAAAEARLDAVLPT